MLTSSVLCPICKMDIHDYFVKKEQRKKEREKTRKYRLKFVREHRNFFKNSGNNSNNNNNTNNGDNNKNNDNNRDSNTTNSGNGFTSTPMTTASTNNGLNGDDIEMDNIRELEKEGEGGQGVNVVERTTSEMMANPILNNNENQNQFYMDNTNIFQNNNIYSGGGNNYDPYYPNDNIINIDTIMNNENGIPSLMTNDGMISRNNENNNYINNENGDEKKNENSYNYNNPFKL